MSLDGPFEAALRSGDPFLQLRSLAERLLAEGQTQEAVLMRFESVRQHLREAGREVDEDALSDIMDCLVGWCALHARLSPGPMASGAAAGPDHHDPSPHRGPPKNSRE